MLFQDFFDTTLRKHDFNDLVLKRAVVRSVEVIGEAVKNISDYLKKKHPKVEWRKIADMQNRLIHGYFAIDYDIVWDMLIGKMPPLKFAVREIIKEEKSLFE
jgi:uncharacterized protein with HEPN domain